MSSYLSTNRGGVGPSAITIQFSNDVHQLVKLGVRIEKGATLAEGAGIGAGAAVAIGGHWLIGLGVALVGAIAGEVSRDYRKAKVEEMRSKWVGIFGAMDRDEMGLFVNELSRYFPATIPALQSSLLGTAATNRLLA